MGSICLGVVGGAVVAVVGGAVVAVVGGAVVAVVAPGVVVVLTDPWVTLVMSCSMARAGGLGTVAVAGTKAMVMSWAVANFRSWGAPLVSVPWPFDSKLGQLTTMTTPGLPASGVPLAQTSPLVMVDLPGYWRLDDESSSPLYPETNLPRVALAPESALVFGEMVRTPSPLATSPVPALLAGRLGSTL